MTRFQKTCFACFMIGLWTTWQREGLALLLNDLAEFLKGLLGR